MTEEMKQSPSLKLMEDKIDPKNIWGEDGVSKQRKEVAARLTNLIEGEKNSLVISINGGWGTGKTFLLRRWQHQLEKDGSKSIYFNAWEDDFCDDPLVAIFGQLIETFQGGKFDRIMDKVKESGKELIKQGVSNAIYLTTGGSFDMDKFADETLSRYSKQRETKERLRKALENMADEVRKDTQRPLIFIVDELDRCRPTFAIDLLERVKHIFDIPNIVFVFGVNRDELCKSLLSIYGRINATVYLRKFFDMEFNLPPPDSKSFCKHLIQKYSLHIHFSNQGGADSDLDEFLPIFYSCFDLSLRDIDYCIRSFLFVRKNIQRNNEYIFPYLLGALIMLRLIKPQIYGRFIRGEQPASKIMNYIDGFVPTEELEPESNFNKAMDHLEAEFYSIDTNPSGSDSYPQKQRKQLELLKDGKELSEKEYLSNRTQKAIPNRAKSLHYRVNDIINNKRLDEDRGIPVSFFSNLVDITKTEIYRG